MIEKVFDLIKVNLKNPKLYIFVLVILMIGLLVFPYVDANVFYYNRVENRIKILQMISTLDKETIESNPILKNEYNNILSEIDKQKDGSLGSIFSNTQDRTVLILKFITGGCLFWLLGICSLFVRYEKKLYKLICFVVILAVGALSGGLATIIPTVVNPLVNYICYPIVLIVIICLLATYSGKSKKENDS